MILDATSFGGSKMPLCVDKIYLEEQWSGLEVLPLQCRVGVVAAFSRISGGEEL